MRRILRRHSGIVIDRSEAFAVALLAVLINFRYQVIEGGIVAQSAVYLQPRISRSRMWSFDSEQLTPGQTFFEFGAGVLQRLFLGSAFSNAVRDTDDSRREEAIRNFFD